ncbi:MAG TPA: DUF2231 domain-containing protein [Clostridia bacterium]|nr:DUF2231 domain-containing protein [Clostridia bacterium]
MKETLLGFLKGHWLKHPLHPAVVHVPVAAWPGALIFDLLSRMDVGGNAMVRLSFYAIILGLASTLIVVPSGLADWSGIKREKPAWKLGLYHLSINLVATLLFAVNFGLRIETFKTAVQTDTVPLVLSLIGTVLLIVSGYLGGLMVYDRGVSVARMSKAKWRKRAAAAGAKLPD